MNAEGLLERLPDNWRTLGFDERRALPPLTKEGWKKESFEKQLQWLHPSQDINARPDFAALEKAFPLQAERAEASILTVETLKIKWEAIQAAQRSSNNRYASSSEDGSDDEGGMMICAAEYNGVPQGTSNNVMSGYELFINALSECHPMLAGFHVVVKTVKADACCACPCAKNMSPWRKQFGLNVMGAECSLSSQYTPNALVAHLKEKSRKGSSDEQVRFHEAVLVYLETLYKDYWRKGLMHKAFYPELSDKYKAALAAEAEEQEKGLKSLIASVGQLKKEKEESAKKIAAYEAAKQSSPDLVEHLQQNEKLLNGVLDGLGLAKLLRAPVATESEIKRWSNSYNINIKHWEARLGAAKHRPKEVDDATVDALENLAILAGVPRNSKITLYPDEKRKFVDEIVDCLWNDGVDTSGVDEATVQALASLAKVPLGSQSPTTKTSTMDASLKRLLDDENKPEYTDSDQGIWLGNIEHKFSLPEKFKEWRNQYLYSSREEDPTYLFCDLDKSNNGKFAVECYVEDVGSASFRPNKRAKTEEEKMETAVDEGGPTRNFISDVWCQLSNLSTMDKNRKVISLFCDCRGFLLPQIDDILVTSVALEEIRAWYKAVGRIIFHCLARKLIIADHVLPEFYRNFLLRGIEPCGDDSSARYPIRELVTHVFAILPQYEDFSHDTEKEGVTAGMEKFCNVLGSGFDASESKESFFRQSVDEYFVKGRSIALSALKEGITLDGAVDVAELFGLMPLSVLTAIIFAKQKIEPISVINALLPAEFDGNSRTANQRRVLDEKAGEKTGLLVDYLKGKDEESLRDFLCFASGYKFMPRSMDFKIKVEFTESDANSWPVAHSCTMEVVLPVEAYDAEYETLAEKLDEAILQMQNVGYSRK